MSYTGGNATHTEIEGDRNTKRNRKKEEKKKGMKNLFKKNLIPEISINYLYKFVFTKIVLSHLLLFWSSFLFHSFLKFKYIFVLKGKVSQDFRGLHVILKDMSFGPKKAAVCRFH